jgi:aspartyl-tRNA(Asn)/glutamyl-tRNA(Gln) amidotransferase subunit A
MGALLNATEVVVARRWQWLVREDFRRAFERCDLLVAPTLPHLPPRIGQPIRREPGLAWNRFMVPFNLAGLPAISLPCGFADGLPVGLQIAGRPFDELTVLQAARAYERETDWHRRRPPAA